MTRRFVRLLAIGTAALAIAACTKTTAGATLGNGVKLVKAGTLTACTHLPAPPFESKDASGKFVGFDIDLVGLFAKKLNVQPTFIDTPFEGIRTGADLRTGKCDLAATGITITPERKAVLDFSVPYFDDAQGLMVKATTPYHQLTDLRGKKVGAQSGTTGLDYAKAHEKADGYSTVEYQDVAAMQQALATGQIDGAVHDLSVWTDFVKHNTGYRIASTFTTGQQYGIALARGANPKLLSVVNDVITTAKADGTYAAIYKKWIGTAPPA
ncbi:ABC transporter substrate-binding protein [Fodinicola acaciae]|uniref:ABC transporter substrate-binding protein n=1 Tax=Fodinicola acaciae TaxID=2681555 RepID=UPI0013D7AD78|nr:ABC transporter substrate-binding protein [Fodinicola acaciae]